MPTMPLIAAPRPGRSGMSEMYVTVNFLLALGPHPRRELTLMLALGFSRPRLGMAAGASFSYRRRGPLPRRELTLMLALGFSCPRARMAAGAALTSALNSSRRC